MKRRITTWRRGFQIVSSLIILYSAFLVGWHIKTPLPSLDPDPGKPRTTRYERGDILWASGDPPILEIYPPMATCRFIARGGVFKACFVHMLSENLTWLTPVKDVLPHILVFIVLAFLLARFWCGWLCPLGFLSDILSIVRRRLGLPYWQLPKLLRDGLVWFKYLLLGFTLILSLVIALPGAQATGLQDELFLPFCQLCPARIIFPLLGGVTPCWYSFDSVISTVFTFIGWLFLLLFLVGFFIRRFWCRFCPIGVLISFFNRGGLVTKEKQVRKCTRCGICATCCPVQSEKIYEEKESKVVNHTECIFCFRCLDLCPEEECLQVKFLGMRIFKSTGK